VIYLDHHAAAPTPEVVRRAMDAAVGSAWANPSSTHAAGREAKRLLEAAREQVAAVLGSPPSDLVLTGGGTEACNLGVRGVAGDRRRVVTTKVEHPAVAKTVMQLESEGREVMRLDVPRGTPPSPSALREHLDSNTAVAVQWINHETGTRFPVEAYATACAETGASLFIDATQALGKVLIDVGEVGADALAVAAHKVGGPPSAGACWLRRGLDVAPVLAGGSQERGRRPGTPDTLSMVGFGAAAGLVDARIAAQPTIARLRDRIEVALVELGAVRNAEGPRAATVTNLSVRGWEGALLAAAMDVEGVCLSTGAACSSGLQAPSEVLLAMYPDEQWRAGSAVRISLGMETTGDEIDAAIAAFRRVLARTSP
jgi:cysteine desulfurase